MMNRLWPVGMLRNFTKPRRRERPRVPAGLRLYVVGDVHGSAGALRDVFARIDADRATAKSGQFAQIFLGDYVDRGPASREVLDILIDRLGSRELLLLKGNHEAMFLEFLEDPSSLGDWRHNGGLQTLISYGLKPSLNPSPEEQSELADSLVRVAPREHRALISKMPTTYTCGDYFFVHAGVRPGVPFKEQKEEDLLWIREDFLVHDREFEKIVVHGHTPVKEPDVRHNRINLDVGAYATGTLACMVMDGDTIDFV